MDSGVGSLKRYLVMVISIVRERFQEVQCETCLVDLHRDIMGDNGLFLKFKLLELIRFQHSSVFCSWDDVLHNLWLWHWLRSFSCLNSSN